MPAAIECGETFAVLAPDKEVLFWQLRPAPVRSHR